MVAYSWHVGVAALLLRLGLMAIACGPGESSVVSSDPHPMPSDFLPLPLHLCRNPDQLGHSCLDQIATLFLASDVQWGLNPNMQKMGKFRTVEIDDDQLAH